MGGRGAFLKEGGFIKQRYRIVDFIEGIKILRPKDDKESLGLPERSGTPNTSYVCYKDDGTFKEPLIKAKRAFNSDPLRCFVPLLPPNVVLIKHRPGVLHFIN